MVDLTKKSLAALSAAGAAPEAELVKAERLSRETGQDLYSVLGRLGLVGQEAWAEAMARAFEIAFLRSADFAGSPIHDARLSPEFQASHKVIVLSNKEEAPRVAVADPSSDFIRRALTLSFGRLPELAVAIEREIDAALAGVDGAAEGAPIADRGQEIHLSEGEAENLKGLASEAPIIRYVSDLIARAARARASDIHIEPHEAGARVRLRVDGRLQQTDEIPAGRTAGVLSRIKILSRLDIAERRLAQDGRFRLRMEGRDFDIRVATSPALHGETAVLRLLEQSRAVPKFSELGMTAGLAARFGDILKRRDGLILVTGPTGSGKTTTLYAALETLSRAERKIITAEDPVELQITGAVQIEVKPDIGRSFAHILRSALRQNPDIMMIGEMRDTETARIAVQAAMTGHLVLATLHTNSAADVVPRLADLGVEPYLIDAVLRAALAQRLIRRLCTECRVAVAPGRVEEAIFTRAGLKPPKSLFAAKGCERCAGRGFRGRQAIYELFEPGKDGGLFEGHSLARAALAEAIRGTTSLEEALLAAGGD